jgi:putative membrane protein
MRWSFPLALLAASVLANSGFAQSPSPNVRAPAPPPTVPAPAVVPGAPVAPLTASDARFVETQIENNMAESQAAQLALQRSRDQNVRNFAEKMITDDTYAQDGLAQIVKVHRLESPETLTEQHHEMLDRLARSGGPAFDRVYVNSVIRANAIMIDELNSQLTHGWDQHISAWVQNTRPILLQHSAIAQQLLASLPPTG